MGKDLSEEQVSLMKEAYSLFDTNDGSGIAPFELRILMRDMDNHSLQKLKESPCNESEVTKFVEKLRQDLPSKEMKIQLLHDVAQEFSIEWNSKALEQRLQSPPQLHEHNEFPHGVVDKHITATSTTLNKCRCSPLGAFDNFTKQVNYYKNE
ncbi:hypothetical protein JHK87_041046 [Glycine soja]|nr:hypothetical protein JHK87_041046 [Glycine soja]